MGENRALNKRVVLGNTILTGMNKSGNLKPDSDGYYTVVLGALGVGNSEGEFYSNTPTSRATFSVGSLLFKRISEGRLNGEEGHPDPSNHTSFRSYISRAKVIKEDRKAFHIRKIWLQDIEYQGKKTVGIMGEIIPSGIFGPSLEKSLNNPHENVCFSGRFFSNLSERGGIKQREIHTCITFDRVSDSGIAMANKYASPSLESIGDTIILKEELEKEIEFEAKNRAGIVSMESNGGISANTLYEELGFKSQSNKNDNASMKW